MPEGDVNYKPNKTKTRDQMEGRSDDAGKVGVLNTACGDVG